MRRIVVRMRGPGGSHETANFVQDLTFQPGQQLCYVVAATYFEPPRLLACGVAWLVAVRSTLVLW